MTGRARSRTHVVAAGVVAILALAAVLVWQRTRPQPTRDQDWQVLALEFGHTQSYDGYSLIQGATGHESRALSFLVFLVRRAGRVVLVDTGFAASDRAGDLELDRFTPLPELLDSIGLSCGMVTDVVLTHVHWDHAGQLAAFPSARYHVQRKELEFAHRIVDEEHPARGGVLLEDVVVLEELVGQGRVHVHDGDVELADGLILHRGGHHTPGMMWVEVSTGERTITLAGDNAYLYDNLEKLLPTKVTSDPEADVDVLRRIVVKASDPALALPGHDPRILERFEHVATSIVEVR